MRKSIIVILFVSFISLPTSSSGKSVGSALQKIPILIAAWPIAAALGPLGGVILGAKDATEGWYAKPNATKVSEDLLKLNAELEKYLKEMDPKTKDVEKAKETHKKQLKELKGDLKDKKISFIKYIKGKKELKQTHKMSLQATPEGLREKMFEMQTLAWSFWQGNYEKSYDKQIKKMKELMAQTKRIVESQN